ncbi:MAG: hypothetical protein QW689_08865 [Nitrososphaerota archaeon]
MAIEGFRFESEFAEKGLQNMLYTAHSLIKRHRDDMVFIKATGGFKPEVTAVSLLAFVLRRPVCYRHETFRTTDSTFPLPINWRDEMLDVRYRSALRLIPMEEFVRGYGLEMAEEMSENLLLIKETGDAYE